MDKKKVTLLQKQSQKPNTKFYPFSEVYKSQSSFFYPHYLLILVQIQVNYNGRKI